MKFAASTPLITVAASIAIALFSHCTPVAAEEPCASKTCALACNRHSHTCGLYNRNNVPSGYVRVSYMPNGYHRSGAECTAIRCPDGSTTCQRWGIAKKSQ